MRSSFPSGREKEKKRADKKLNRQKIPVALDSFSLFSINTQERERERESRWRKTNKARTLEKLLKTCF